MLHTHNEFMKTEQWDVTHLDIIQVRTQAMAKVAGSVSHLAYRISQWVPWKNSVIVELVCNPPCFVTKCSDHVMSAQPYLLRNKSREPLSDRCQVFRRVSNTRPINHGCRGSADEQSAHRFTHICPSHPPARTKPLEMIPVHQATSAKLVIVFFSPSSEMTGSQGRDRSPA